MSGFPGGARTLRGAIAQIGAPGRTGRVVVFQYNPDAVTRTLRPRQPPSAQQVGPADAHRVWGAPVETLTMTVELDATDRLEADDGFAVATGIAGRLAMLELLLYPSAAQVVANSLLLAAGTIEILPPEAPLTVLVWGPGRVVPVRVDGLTVTEQAFDAALNPVRASVEISAQVLSYNDLPVADPGHAMFLAHQVAKEVLAAAAGAADAVSVAGALALGR